MSEDIFPLIKIEKLAKKHNLKSYDFDCSDKDLNEFLLDDALNQQKKLVAVTHLCFYKEKLIAYFSLCADSIRFDTKDEKMREFRKELIKDGIEYKQVLALKIARLAVCRYYQKSEHKIGTNLIKLIFGKALNLSSDIGCRFVTADVKRTSMPFYEKLEFKHLLDEKEETEKDYPPLYFDLLHLTSR